MMFRYFDIEISQGKKARFRRNRFTGSLWVFRSNCAPTGNTWNAPGYGYGVWARVR